MSTKSSVNSSIICRSAPINEIVAASSCVAVYERGNEGLKFIHLDTGKYKGRYLVFVVMDSNLTNAEARNMMSFNDNLEKFRGLDARIIGVATVSNISLRSWMTNKLRGLKFPVIADVGGDLCHALGILGPDTHHSPRSLAILDPEGCLIHLSKYNQNTLPQPKSIIKFLEIIRDNENQSGKLFLEPLSDYTATIEDSISVSQLSLETPQSENKSAASPDDNASSRISASTSRIAKEKDMLNMPTESEKSAATSSKKPATKSPSSTRLSNIFDEINTDESALSSEMSAARSQISSDVSAARSGISSVMSGVQSNISSKKSRLNNIMNGSGAEKQKSSSPSTSSEHSDKTKSTKSSNPSTSPDNSVKTKSTKSTNLQ